MRKEEEVDGEEEEEEGPTRPGPHLHLKLSNDIYNKMRLFAVRSGIYVIPSPRNSSFPCSQFRQTDGADGGVEEVKQYKRK